MRKEQELRDAARDGNIAKLESLLAGKKNTIISSLRKTLNINCQDENGNTALHLAALNGQSKAAILLLQNDASANIPDASGNYPLHLAAFNGHNDVIDILINHGPSKANVLEQNSSLDTALHIASQYGHTQVVNALLECHSDPHMRNKKGESPLDLAAMYGRLSTVQVLVLSDKMLVRDRCKTHSPLHLAARNGHTSVIEALLDSGMSVDTICERGSALHEAALFGKVDAVKLLLNRGIDVNEINEDGSTVLDLLVDLPSERSHEITALIYEQSQMMNSAEQRSKSFSVTSQSSIGSKLDSNNAEKQEEDKMVTSRSVSVYQRKTEPNYVLVQHPRLSRIENNLNQAAVSPLFEDDTATQGDIFNDEFLRRIPTTIDRRENEQSEISTLEDKKVIAPNVYEDMPPPESKGDAIAVYDTVPSSRFGSMTSESSRDSVPAFPPPSSDEAMQSVRNLMNVNEASSSNRNTPSERAVYENFNFIRDKKPAGWEKDIADQSDSIYDNVLITNKPLDDNRMQKTETGPSGNYLQSDKGNLLESNGRTVSGIKQKRTRESRDEKTGSTLNESYEWSKIDKIFSSFEDLINCDPLTIDEGSEEALESVGGWLSRLGLSHYEASFLANGYDDIRFIGADMLDEDDLLEIGIQNTDHIKDILQSTSGLPRPPQIGVGDNPIPETVLDWLVMIGLRDYESRFIMNRYENMDRIRAIWEFELTTVVGIHLAGHRKRMIYSLGRRPEHDREKVSWSQRFAAAEAPKTSKPSSNDDAMALANQLLKEAEEMASGFEKRQTDIEKKQKTQSDEPKTPASPRVLKYQPSLQWIHKPETLLYASASYPTQYLGSHPVVVVRGTQSTLEACRKMKSTSQMLQKVPIIQLSMSVRGIDFIDAQSGSTISSYDIRFISYCAQDPEDLSVFAYITKDSGTSKHYCHVFKASNNKLADEIVLTIGQAFELAYHQHRLLIEGKRSSLKDDVNETPTQRCDNQLESQDILPDKNGTVPPAMPKPYAEYKQMNKEQSP